MNDETTPVIPVSQFSVNIPLNATTDSVTVNFSNAENLGELNIPAFKPVPPMPDDIPDGGYVPCPTNIGIFPPSQYSYKVIEIDGFQQVIVTLLPVVYNSATQQTTLYRSAAIQVSYTTPNQGLVQNFTSDKRTYAIAENVATQTTIENTTANNANFSVTVQIQDLSGTVISSKVASQSIASNSIGTIDLNLLAPNLDGPYNLVMSSTDGTNVIGQSIQDINVVSGKIIVFTAPLSIVKDNYGTFSIEFQNFSDSQINAFENIYIYDSNNNEVARLPQILETINAGETKITSTQWFPPNFLPSGSYKAQLVVSVNDAQFIQFSESFLISGANDIALSSPGWHLVSLPLHPSDTSINNVLASISGKYLSAWAFQNGGWLVYDPANPDVSDLANMEAGWGYWLNMSEASTLSITGTAPSKTVNLISGWNLVGYNASSPLDIGNALASIDSNVISVWAYMNNAWLVYDPANPALNDLSTLTPGFGYWINTNGTCTWTLP